MAKYNLPALSTLLGEEMERNPYQSVPCQGWEPRLANCQCNPLLFSPLALCYYTHVVSWLPKLPLAEATVVPFPWKTSPPAAQREMKASPSTGCRAVQAMIIIQDFVVPCAGTVRRVQSALQTVKNSCQASTSSVSITLHDHRAPQVCNTASRHMGTALAACSGT